MNAEILNDLLPVAINLFVVTVFFTYLFIKTPTSYRLKYLGIPLLLLSAFISVSTFDNLLGRSVWGAPEVKFTLISYRPIGSDPKDSIIETWLYLPDGTTKLYKFPYSKELLEKLKKIVEKQQEGKMVVGEMVDEKLTFKILNPAEIIQK